MARCKRCARSVKRVRVCPHCGVGRPVEHGWPQVAAVWLAVGVLLAMLSFDTHRGAPPPSTALRHADNKEAGT